MRSVALLITPAIVLASSTSGANENIASEAQAAIDAGNLTLAETILRAHLQQVPRDDDCLAVLARIVSWKGDLQQAEILDRQLLDRRPNDDDVRAGLVDVLTWLGRLDEADSVARQGLSLPGEHRELWLRRAKLAYFSGNVTEARDDLDRAGDSVEVTELRRRLFVGELRVVGHVDAYPQPYPTLLGARASYLGRWQRWSLGVSTEQAQKPAAPGESSYNGSYAATLEYALGPRISLGIEGGFGAPAPAVPRWLVGGFATAPLISRTWGSLAYSYRYYSNAGASDDVHSVHPSFGFAFSDSLEFVAHYWLAIVRFSGVGEPSQSLQWLNSAGLSITYRPTTRMSLTGTYSYGNQVDLNASIFQVTHYQSHFLSLFFDWFATDHWGWTGMYQLEIRNLPSQSIAIHTFELGTYVRW